MQASYQPIEADKRAKPRTFSPGILTCYEMEDSKEEMVGFSFRVPIPEIVRSNHPTAIAKIPEYITGSVEEPHAAIK